MTTATITRITETFDIADSYKLADEYTLTTTPSADVTVTAMKELMLKLAGGKALGYSEENGWGSLLLDMVCLKAADRSNWQQPIAHLLPVLKRLGTEAQVEQALAEFAEDNAPTFTTIEEFEWGRVGGLYWEPHYWWGYLKKFATPEIQQGFWDKMQEFWEEWDPCTPELEADFAEFEKAAKIAALDDFKQDFIRINTDTAPAWYVDAIRERGIEIKETVEQIIAREKAEYEVKYAKCQPTYSKPLTLDEYRKALSTVDDPSVPDTTGVRGFVELELPGNENKAQRSQFYSYLISRLDIEKSKVRRLLLEATTGEAVYSPLIQVLNNRKWATYSPD